MISTYTSFLEHHDNDKCEKLVIDLGSFPFNNIMPVKLEACE